MVPAPRRETLFIAVLPLPFSTTGQRLIVRNELIWAYNPPCQIERAQSQPAELVAKLEELERRHQEQTAELRLLFAARGSLRPGRARAHLRAAYCSPGTSQTGFRPARRFRRALCRRTDESLAAQSAGGAISRQEVRQPRNDWAELTIDIE